MPKVEPFAALWVLFFYLPFHNIIIEVQGDYWHGNPKLYGDGKCKKPLSEYQKKRIKKDKIRFEYLRSKGYNLYDVWEKDIYDDIDSALYFLSDLT